MEIEFKNTKQMIYKYYPANGYSLDALEKEYFWCSKRKFLNDPFDTHGEVINRFPLFKEELRSKGYNLDSYPTILDKFGICCFSEDALNKHLWAFYGDSYKGWCLEFEDEEFEDNFSSQELCKVTYSKVEYLSEWPDLDNFDTLIPNYNKELKQIRKIQFDKEMDSIFEYLMLIKEKSTWENEKEKRILLGSRYADRHTEPEDDNGYKLSWPRNILKRIIVGHNISSDNLAEITQIATNRGVPIYQTKTIDTGLGFEIELEIVRKTSENQ